MMSGDVRQSGGYASICVGLVWLVFAVGSWWTIYLFINDWKWSCGWVMFL